MYKPYFQRHKPLEISLFTIVHSSHIFKIKLQSLTSFDSHPDVDDMCHMHWHNNMDMLNPMILGMSILLILLNFIEASISDPLEITDDGQTFLHREYLLYNLLDIYLILGKTSDLLVHPHDHQYLVLTNKQMTTLIIYGALELHIYGFFKCYSTILAMEKAHTRGSIVLATFLTRMQTLDHVCVYLEFFKRYIFIL
ncbi:hypothetical protein ACJX0J_019082 [Zea mays]